MGEPGRISDFIDIKILQSIQDDCSKAMGLAFVTVDYRGVPVTRYSGFTQHCMLGRQSQGFAELCEQCDAHGGLHAAITGQPYIYRCHADLVDFAVPLLLDGSYMGAVLGGQVRLCDDEEQELERILPRETRWKKNKAMEEAYQKAERTTYERIESAVKVLRDMIVYIMHEQCDGAAKEELKGKNGELAEERAARSDLEVAVHEQELRNIQQQEGFRYFFFIMNLIAGLAYKEKAVQTGAVVYDFADMMRYLTDPDHKISTLGEELSYTGALLRIQKAWVGEQLSYSISVPERYWGVPCPFLVFQPIVEYSLIDVGEDGGEQRQISIFAEEEGDDLLIEVLNNNEQISWEELETQLNEFEGEERFSLQEADHSLRRTLGRRYGLSVEARRDGRAGSAIAFRLPLG